MISLRTAARQAPRFLTKAVRPATRTTSIFTSRVAARQATAAFSTSVLRAAARAGEVDEELSAKLGSEIEYENDVKENEPLPASIKDFLENGPFEIQDTPGKEEVTLTRTFGSEKITIKFSIADLQNYDPDMFDEDSALGDSESSEHNHDNDNSPEATPEGESDDSAVPCRLTVIVEKPSQPGALNIEATAQDGSIIVDNLYYFSDKSLAYADSSEAAHAAQGRYAGPPFGSLDEDLQILMERFLEERGVTQALAVFVPDYMDVKEQREYLSWLEGLKKFIDA
ncbi:mitochondrial glyco protein [Coniochaeta sp. 2T2.1]|nr:mitochondrial glyco protein [Coniochaeta sp. 2T2.1]